ncbi:MAG: aldo/keto reductase [Candidatus Cloacimonetes bacterium]|nr:aldo/keto reductase [Candidatus Cloacimonadota bacterium]
MRLPVVEGEHGKIDFEKAKEMFDFALANGINYFDTAYPYHKGMSEGFLREALGDRRKQVFIADKLPCWAVKENADFDRLLQEQLLRLGTDYIDFYLLHALNAKSWPIMKELGVLEWLEKQKEKGLIRHIGFSFHDKLKVFKEIIRSYNWEFCQIQYNYMDTEFQAGEAGLKYAAKRGIDVIVMEPLKGGLLAKEPPDDVKKAVKELGIVNGNVNLGLRWVWEQPEVKILLSGMNNMEQMKENIAIAGKNEIPLTKEEHHYLQVLKNTFQERLMIGCTECNYCRACPQKVAIPIIFRFYNTACIYEAPKWGQSMYSLFLREENRADKCIQCGHCETRCPQDLPIMETLVKADKYLRGI